MNCFDTFHNLFYRFPLCITACNVGHFCDITVEELNRRIKFLEKNVKVLQRLYFVKNRYAGESVEESANRVGITKQVAYIWQERWNQEGYDGLKPKFAGGKPSKLSDKWKSIKRIISAEFCC